MESCTSLRPLCSRLWTFSEASPSSVLANYRPLQETLLLIVTDTTAGPDIRSKANCFAKMMGEFSFFCGLLRSSYTMRTKYAISDAFVRDCVFAYSASVAQYVFSLSAECCFRLRNNAISDERVRDCALSTHSVFRPLRSGYIMRTKCAISDAFIRDCVFA